MSIKSLSKQKQTQSKKRQLIEDVIEPGRIRTVSFAQAYPEIATLWDYAKNCGFGPEDFAYASSVSAWFKCPRGKDHRFRTLIASMSKAGKTGAWSMGCGFCRGLKASVTNNLADKYPHLAKEWMVTKNGYKPNQISSGSNKKAWWKCKCGHNWKATISKRTSNETGCPKCNLGTSIDLRDYPEVLAEFDYKKNRDIDPYALPTVGTFSWRCTAIPTHTWVSGFARTTKRARCPYCTNQKGSKENNLKKSHPALAKQWHTTRNQDLKPTDVTSGSNRKAWWCCPKGPDHQWEARICARAKRNSGCPFCISNRVSITNCLATRFPKIAKEWHPTKNKPKTPKLVNGSTSDKYWWKCKRGHVWLQGIQVRTIRGSNCPTCRKLTTAKKT